MNGIEATASTLFHEVKIFDGRSDQLSDPTDVLITGNTIATIAVESVTSSAAGQLDWGQGTRAVVGPGTRSRRTPEVDQSCRSSAGREGGYSSTCVNWRRQYVPPHSPPQTVWTIPCPAIHRCTSLAR